MFDLIKTLTELSGPVGQEDIVLDYVKSLWQVDGVEVEQNGIGNVIARVGGQGPKILLVAHADELCYLVRSIDQAGFIWLANGQGWNRTTSWRDSFTLGQRVRVLSRTGEIPGVIATPTGHLAAQSLHEPHQLSWNDFWVDTGLSLAELRARGVTPGTRIIWEATTEKFGHHIVGKALDDRVPLAILTELLQQVKPDNLACELTLACTVQEEIGLVGAYALATEEKFDAAIALEVGMAGDIPGVLWRDMPVSLGHGPILIHKDAMVHYDYALTQALENVAQAARIPIQHAIFGSFGSDGAALMRANIPTALVAFPTRYTHSPFEMAHLADIENLVNWLCAFIQQNVRLSK